MQQTVARVPATTCQSARETNIILYETSLVTDCAKPDASLTATLEL
jgi:hypothetical protein